jgi:site-specific recombinase XerD
MGKKITPGAIRGADATCALPVLLPHGRRAEIPGFDPYVAWWIGCLRQCGCAEGTITSYFNHLEKALAHAVSCFGEKFSIENLASLGERLDALQDYLLDRVGWKMSSLSIFRTAIQACCLFLTIKHSIRCDRISIWKPKPHKKDRSARVGHLDAWSTLVAFMESMKTWHEKRDRALYAMVATTKIKAGEALALNGAAFDPSDGIFRFSGDSGEGKQIYDKNIASMLQAYVASCPYRIRPDGPLFLNLKGGRLTLPVVQISLRKRRRELGLDEKLTMRSMRSAQIVALLWGGTNDKEVRTISRVGHTSHFRDSIETLPISERRMSEGLENVQRVLTDGIEVMQVGEGLAVRGPTFNPAKSKPKAERKRGPIAKPVCDPDVQAFIAQEKMSHPCLVTLRDFDQYLTHAKLRSRNVVLEDLRSYIEYKSKGSADSSILIYCNALNKFYGHLFSIGAIEMVPTIGLDRPLGVGKPPKAVHPDVVRIWITTLASSAEPNLLLLRIAALIALFGLEDKDVETVRWMTVENALQQDGARKPLAKHTVAVLRRLARASGAGAYLISQPERQRTSSETNGASMGEAGRAGTWPA